MKQSHFDVVIIGAGPAGCGCALALKDAGLKVALVDKSTFPRTKTCGDAIPGPSLRYLREIDENLAQDFEQFAEKVRVNSSLVHLPNSKVIQVNWKTTAYNSKRFSFDDFLLDLVKKHTDTTLLEGAHVEDITQNEQVCSIKIKQSETPLTCKMVVGSDGANSIVSRKLAGYASQNPFTAVALSTYYKHVENEEHSNTFFFLEDITGYFWIFPVAPHLYNVGFGLLETTTSQDNNIRKSFSEIIASHPVINKRLKHATMTSKLKGFKLPLAGTDMPTSGERFLLTGDAAHLIDPMGGHGIDKAIKSGSLAADHIKRCFAKNDFSSEFNTTYDQLLFDALGKELKRNFHLMKMIGSYPWLLKASWLGIKGYNMLQNLIGASDERKYVAQLNHTDVA